MIYRNLGRAGLKVAAFCLGGNTFGWTTDQKQSEAVLDAYVEAGGNFVDTADVYSRWAAGHVGGESETVIGKWMKARGNRSQVVIVTKVNSPMGDGPNDRGLSRHHIVEAIDASLRRLQTDYVDVYMAHADEPNNPAPLDETLRAFDDLVHAGKVRYVACSNYKAYRLAKALGVSERNVWARYECLQPKYNLMFRDEYERELEPLCREENVGVITYSSLGSGFFSGKYRRGQEAPKTPRAGGVQNQYANDRGWRILDAVDSVAKASDATTAQVALAWIAHRPGITAPIASATSPEQVKDLVGCVDLKLDAEAVKQLDEASAWR